MHKPANDPIFTFIEKKRGEGKSGKLAMVAGLNKFLRSDTSYPIGQCCVDIVNMDEEVLEPPAFWSVGCLTHKSEPFRLRFVLFATVCSADFPLFPSSPARFFRILGQKWVRGCNIRRDWRTATLRHSPHYLSSYHNWRKGQRFVGVFVHHGSCFGLGDRVKVTTVDILIRCDGVAPW